MPALPARTLTVQRAWAAEFFAMAAAVISRMAVSVSLSSLHANARELSARLPTRRLLHIFRQIQTPMQILTHFAAITRKRRNSV